MNRWFWEYGVSVLLSGAALLGAPFAHAAGELVTEPERCIFLGAPYEFAFMQAENLLLMNNRGGLYAFDIASGEQRWHRYLASPGGYVGAAFGKRQVLGWSDQGVFLLDAVTGRETWWRRDSQCGQAYQASLSPDESRVVLCCERGSLLYGVTDHSQRVLPQISGFCGWLSGSKAVIFVKAEGQGDKQTQNWQVMDTDTGTVTPCWQEPRSWEDSRPAFSHLGQFASVLEGDNNSRTLKIRDTRTGTVLHEFGDVAGLSSYVFWMQDGKRLCCTTEDRKEARVIDAETGAVQFALSREGHSFVVSRPFEDGLGTAWIFSKDGANHRYAWNLAPDGTPRKVLDGARISPAHFYFDRSLPGRWATMTMEEDRLWVYAVHALENSQKLAEWRCRVPKQLYGGFTVNKALTHVVGSYQVKSDDYGRPQNMMFTLYVQDREAPVRTGHGRVLAISPDGRYLALQTDDKETCLYDAESDRIADIYAVADKTEGQRSMNASFSDDGKRMVVNTTTTIEVTDLSEGYPRRSMALGDNKGLWWVTLCFSPDSARLLCGGNDRSWLFDAATGALLHSFEETERFADLYSYQGGGFWNSLAESAKDWAGLVTDRFKQGGHVDVAFADNGSRVITYAAGQVVRVWDAGSGRMLHAIHTGLPEKRNREGTISNKITLSANGRFAFSSNGDNYARAALWSVADGTLLRRYQLPESTWAQAMPADDGKAVSVISNYNLYRWPGAPQELLDQLPNLAP